MTKSMARTITVITPENITITYQAAGIASRFMAVVVDALILLASSFLTLKVIQWIVGNNVGGIGPGSLLSSLGIVLALLVIPFTYFVFFETIWAGRTPGKRLLRLRTVRDGGYPITPLSSIIRNLLLVIDIGFIFTTTPIILWGLPGIVCMFFSPKYKRIGDYAAGTLVVIEHDTRDNRRKAKQIRHKQHAENETTAKKHWWQKRESRHKTGMPTPNAVNYEVFLPYVRNLDRLTIEDYQLLRRFVARRPLLDPDVTAGLAERIARPIMTRLEIQIPIYYQLQYADILAAIERRYTEDRGIVQNNKQF